jgi:hypothetical protein
MTREKLIEIYDPAIHSGVKSAARQVLNDKITPEQKENLAKLDQAELVIQDLERLRIIVQDWISESDGYVQIPYNVGNFKFDSSIAGKKVALHRNRTEIQSYFSLSLYGVSFIRAVSL